jgi:3-hydroxyacyl-[acyl-carrier-protein] dehydratase
MTQEELKAILPHRDNMLLVDEATVIDGEAHGKKTIRGDEWFLQGHFPGNPVVPGVILCEILAQSVCVLLGEGRTQPFTPYFTGLDKVSFKHPVRPGDTLETVCSITRSKGAFYRATGKGYVNGTMCVTADFSFALIEEGASADGRA